MYFSLEVIEKIETEIGSFVVDRVLGTNNNFLKFPLGRRVELLAMKR
jgi:hypothetical protein